MFRQILVLTFAMGQLMAQAPPLVPGIPEGYELLGQPCDPAKQNGGVLTEDNKGTVCLQPGKCNPATKLCDCGISDDGEWKSTWEGDQCRLLPESQCIQGIDQNFHRCVQNAQCVKTREGKEHDPSKCTMENPCDFDLRPEFHCKCDEGKTCLNVFNSAPKA